MVVKRSLALLLPLCIVWIASGREAPAPVAGSIGQEDVARWVAFSATVRTVVPGVADTVGRFWRDVDGSTRFDASSGETSQIIINNIAQRAHYRLLRAGAGDAVWTRQPLQLPPDGWHPRRARASGAAPEPSGEMVNGYSVVRSVGQDGTVRLLAERLDYFALVEEVPGGRRTEYSAVVIGPQDRALFEPPLGSPVKVVDTPSGIVFVPKGATGQTPRQQ